MANAFNLSSTVPAAPSARTVNLAWQHDASSPVNISAYTPGMASLPVSASSSTVLGLTVFAAASTITPGANHLLHLRLSAYRSSASVVVSLVVANGSNQGYCWRAQADGNLVVYSYGGSLVALASSGASFDDLAGPVMIELFMGITATGTNGISAGGIWSGLNKGLLMFSTSTGTGNGGAFGQVEKNTSYSMTGALTVAAEIDAAANVYTLEYETL